MPFSTSITVTVELVGPTNNAMETTTADTKRFWIILRGHRLISDSSSSLAAIPLPGSGMTIPSSARKMRGCAFFYVVYFVSNTSGTLFIFLVSFCFFTALDVCRCQRRHIRSIGLKTVTNSNLGLKPGGQMTLFNSTSKGCGAVFLVVLAVNSAGGPTFLEGCFRTYVQTLCIYLCVPVRAFLQHCCYSVSYAHQLPSPFAMLTFVIRYLPFLSSFFFFFWRGWGAAFCKNVLSPIASSNRYLSGGTTPAMLLSSGTEDYFLGTYYFNKGKYVGCSQRGEQKREEKIEEKVQREVVVLYNTAI